jgi:hypothetical protein
MFRVHGDPLDQFLDQGSTLTLFGCFQNFDDVQVSEQAGDLLEPLPQFAAGAILSARLMLHSGPAR